MLLTTVTLKAMTSMVTVAPARNPVPLINTGVGRSVEPVAGEIPVTVGAAAATWNGGVGPDGDATLQAERPAANADTKTPRWVIVVIDMFL